MKVREFSREDERKLRIVFDNPAAGAVCEEDYENAVALAASLAWHFAGQNTDVSFVSQGYNGGTGIHSFLAHLALVHPGQSASVIETLRLSGDYNIILTARAPGTIPTTLWACSYFVFVGQKSRVAFPAKLSKTFV